MRTIQEIKRNMSDAFIQNEGVSAIYGLIPGRTFQEEFSVYSLENIFFDVVSFAIWTLESLFYILKNQIDALIVANKHGKLEWYIATALNYQHGFALDDFGDYINGTATPEEIEDSKIIANVAFEKAVINGHGVIRAKVVKEDDNGEYEQLSPSELAGFHAYINKKTLFGLSVISISRPHDVLRVNMKIWYDPLVLGANGARLDGSDPAPVITAIKTYLRSLEFNGEFIATRMIDVIQQVQGVSIPRLESATARAGQAGVGQSMETIEIEEIYQTFAGYMRLDVNNSTFEYIAR